MHVKKISLIVFLFLFALIVSCEKKDDVKTVKGKLQVLVKIDENERLSTTTLAIESGSKTYSVVRNKKTAYINVDDGNGYVWHSGETYEVKGTITKDTIVAQSIRYLETSKAVKAVTAEKADDNKVEKADNYKDEGIVPVAVDGATSKHSFNAVIVNIAGTEGARYLKLGYSLSYDSDLYPDFDKKIGRYSSKLHSRAVQYLSALTLDEVINRNAQMNIRTDLKREFNRVFDKGSIECSNVYITEFLIQ